jgi:hypothetical protein
VEVLPDTCDGPLISERRRRRLALGGDVERGDGGDEQNQQRTVPQVWDPLEMLTRAEIAAFMATPLRVSRARRLCRLE